VAHGLEILHQPGAGQRPVGLLQEPQNRQFLFFRFFRHEKNVASLVIFFKRIKPAILPLVVFRQSCSPLWPMLLAHRWPASAGKEASHREEQAPLGKIADRGGF
jgi:hypothetical protein